MGRITGFDPAQMTAQLAARAVVPGVNDTLAAMTETAESVTPVDTGHLAASWGIRAATVVSATHVRGSFYNDAEYAGYVNSGTRKMAARNMTGIAVDRNAPDLPGNIKRYL